MTAGTTHTITISSGRSFQAREDESLLDAALRQGITLDYSCRTGRCSTCKGRLDEGHALAARDETGLTAQEIAEGWMLTCVRQARADCRVDIEDLGDLFIPPAKTLPCRIQSLEKLAGDVVRVVLRMPPATPLAFLPGQYVDVIGPGGVRRSYSVANAPREDKLVELHIREVPGGAMSRYWFQEAKANDLLRLNGPLGTFFLRDAAGLHLALLATGTGIAPVKAIVEGLAGTPPETRPASVTVYWGGRHAEDLYWTPTVELTGATALRFVPVLSRAGEVWTGARGHVQDALLADTPDLSTTAVYACGSDAMIHAARARLVGLGLPERRFHSDAFVSSGAA